MIEIENLKKSVLKSNLDKKEQKKLSDLLDLFLSICDLPSNSDEPKIRSLELRIAWMESEAEAEEES